MKVRVSLDDFGTGFSSLSYLRLFPLDKIKIDRSFIMNLGKDSKSAEIVRSIVLLAHSLDLSVTAEGVETSEQLGILRSQSCDQVQGYLLGRPEPMDKLACRLLTTDGEAEVVDQEEQEMLGRSDLHAGPAPASIHTDPKMGGRALALEQAVV